MKKNLFGLLASLILATLTYSAYANTADDTPKTATIAVLPFIVHDSDIIQIGDITIIRKEIEHEFSNKLIAFLVNSQKFTVLDRSNLNDVVNEDELAESMWAAPNQTDKIAKLIVADYLVIGRLNRLVITEKKQHIEITGENVEMFTAKMDVQLKIIKVSTGKIVFADSVEENLTPQYIQENVPFATRKNWTLYDCKNYVFDKMATKVGDEILLNIYPVTIAEVKDGSVILNRGEGAGIFKGQKYKVYHPGKEIIDPTTKQQLGQDNVFVGEIEITSVSHNMSTAKILSKEKDFSVSDICHVIKGEPAPQPTTPDYPRATPQGW